VLDGLLLSVAVGLFTWVLLLAPVAHQGSGGLVGTAVAACYPVLDLMGLLALAWLVLRHRGQSPVWLWCVLAAFGLQVAADLAYLAAALNGLEAGETLSAVTFMAAGWLWVAAGDRRLRTPARAWAPGRDTIPPAWSQALPFLLGVAVLGLATARPERGIVATCLAAAALLAVRAITTLAINRRLIGERDRLLVTDPLTGAYNRRFLGGELERAVARSARAGEPLAVIAVDLDRFKQVNDRYGHGTGDDLLARLAVEAQSSLRLGDLLCRLGGDEFLVLCPATGVDGALELADRLLAGVRRAGWAVAPEEEVTASLGVAVIPEHAGGPRELVARADDAMYMAKRAGGDQAAAYDARACAMVGAGPLSR
jgi:diguanylate cyclase (GGDEF)-like protein